MNTPTIRELTSADATEAKDFILSIIVHEFGLIPTPKWDSDLDHLNEKYIQSGGMFYIMKDKGRIIGTVAVYPHSKDVIELKRLYIHKEWRGKGCGARLLDTALNFARTHTYKKMILDTWENLKPAIALYLKYGFNEYKRENDQIFMKLIL